MTKAELRAQFLTERRALSAEEVTRRSVAIADRFFGAFFNELVADRTTILHTFLPIARQNEVDTWPIIQRIWQHFPPVQVAVSMTDTTKTRLTHHSLTPETPLIENQWGIPEPHSVENQPISSSQIGLVLVPLLTFDAHGHRVGYGKGYYDRFLAECRPDCLKIGVSLFEPVNRIEAVEPTDVRLDVCVTPTRTWHFDEQHSTGLKPGAGDKPTR